MTPQLRTYETGWSRHAAEPRLDNSLGMVELKEQILRGLGLGDSDSGLRVGTETGGAG